jgi:hypothetical protein
MTSASTSMASLTISRAANPKMVFLTCAATGRARCLSG